jgi:hypothetical protein
VVLPVSDTTLLRDAVPGDKARDDVVLARLLTELRKLQGGLSAAEERADLVAAMVRQLLIQYGLPPPAAKDQVPRQNPQSLCTGLPKARRRRPPRTRDKRLIALAEPGVGRLGIHKLETGNVLVSVDGAMPFSLAPTLGELLELIAFAEGDSPDEFPPFQSSDALAAALSKRTGRSCQPHAVVVYVGRLRDSLESAGHLTPLLVETRVRLGVRFRLRRAA